MPLFDYLCADCGQVSEVLVTGNQDEAVCKSCKSTNMKKLLSAHSSLSGTSKPGHAMPGPGDTACCGHAPGQASACAGPGSCCGKN